MQPASWRVQNLRASWQAVRVEIGGTSLPDEQVRLLRYVFAGNRVTLLEGDRVTGEGVVTLSTAVSPNEIDVTMTFGPGKGQKRVGLYELAGTRLRACMGFERPRGSGALGSPLW